MFKFEDNIIIGDNQTATFNISFDSGLIQYITITGGKQDFTKVYKFKNLEKETIITPNKYGILFVQILSIILTDLNLGTVTVEDDQINSIMITKDDWDNLTSEYTVIIINEDKTLKVNRLYKITRID